MDKIKASQFADLAYYCRTPLSAYQQVEYLRGDGTQYIVTSANNASDQTIHIKFRVITEGNGARLFYSGASQIYINYNTSGGPWENYIFNNYAGAAVYGTAVQFEPSEIYTVIINPSTTLTVNNIDYANQVRYGGATTTRLFLLYGQSNDPAQSRLKGDIYEFSIAQGGSKIIDLIPCYRKSDSKPGMYDTVTNTFFTNSGTGEFTVGGNV